MNEIYKMALRNTYNHISSKKNMSLVVPESLFEFAYCISIMFAKSTEDVIADYFVVNGLVKVNGLVEVKNEPTDV